MTMGLRAYINQRPIVTASTVGAVLIGTLAWLAWSVTAGSSEVDLTRFYSVDDGKTWFRDSVNRVPPFRHGDADAVAAYVFTDGASEFVGFLEKYSDDAAKRIGVARTLEERFNMLEHLGPNAILIKRPGVEGWVAADSPEAQAIRQSVWRDGRPARPVTP